MTACFTVGLDSPLPPPPAPLPYTSSRRNKALVSQNGYTVGQSRGAPPLPPNERSHKGEVDPDSPTSPNCAGRRKAAALVSRGPLPHEHCFAEASLRPECEAKRSGEASTSGGFAASLANRLEDDERFIRSILQAGQRPVVTSGQDAGLKTHGVEVDRTSAVIQALVGLSARIFNWSLVAKIDIEDRRYLWELMLQYLSPCEGDGNGKIADVSRRIRAAIPAGHPRPAEQPALIYPDDFPLRFATTLRTEREVHANTRAARVRSTAAAVGDCERASTALVPPITSASPLKMASALGEVTICLNGSETGRRISGIYTKRGGRVGGRLVFMKGIFNLYYQRSAWVIEEAKSTGPELLAYVQDQALEPEAIAGPWHVKVGEEGCVVDERGSVKVGSEEGFVIDDRGSVLPGAFQTSLAPQASVENKAS